MPADDPSRTSRPRCWDRGGRVGVGFDGTLGPVDGSTQVVVIDGQVQSSVTAGSLARAVASGATVVVVAVDTSSTWIDTARAQVQQLADAGGLYNHAVAHLSAAMVLDSRLTDADRRAVARFRAEHSPVGGLTVRYLSDRQVMCWMRATEHHQSLQVTACGLPGPVVARSLATAASPAHAAAELRLAQCLGGDLVRARAKVIATGPADVLRSPALVASGMAHPGLDPDQALAAALTGADRDVVAGRSHKELLRLAAGLPVDADAATWRERLAALSINPAQAADVLCLALHGELDRELLLEHFRSPEPTPVADLLRLSPAALVCAVAGLDDGSIHTSDRVTHAARVAAVFRKRTGEYLDLARRIGWSAHDASASLSVPADGRFADLVLSSQLASWGHPKRARKALQVVSAEWDTLVAHVDELPTSLAEAARVARAMSKLGPVWASTPFADVVGEVGAGRKVARSAAAVWLVSQATPSIYPHHNRYRSGSYTGYFLDRADPRGLFLGDLTDCCQHIGGEGEPCAIDGQSNPTSGFFVVERDGRVVAQSWVWFDKHGRGVCFDNIERLDGALKGDAGNRFHTKVRDVYHQAAQDLAHRWSVTVTVGEGYSDDEFLDGLESTADTLTPSDYHDYRDSHDQRTLAGPGPSRPGAPRPAGALAWEIDGVTVTATRSHTGGRGCVDFSSSQPAAATVAAIVAAENPYQVVTLDGVVVGDPVALDYAPLVEDLDLGPVIERDGPVGLAIEYTNTRSEFADLGVLDGRTVAEILDRGGTPEGLQELMDDCRSIWGIPASRAVDLAAAGVVSPDSVRACLDLGARDLDEAVALAGRVPDAVVLETLAQCTAAKMDHEVLERGIRLANAGVHGAMLVEYTSAADIDESTAARAGRNGVSARDFRILNTDGVLADELARKDGATVAPFTGTADLPDWADADPDATFRLHQGRVDPRLLGIYDRVGLRTFDQAERATALGYDITTLYALRRMTTDTPGRTFPDTSTDEPRLLDVSHLVGDEIPAAQALSYYGVSSLGNVPLFVRLGITPEEIHADLDAGYIAYGTDLLPYYLDDSDDVTTREEPVVQ